MSGIATGKSESKMAFTLERLIFGHRAIIVIIFALVTAALATLAVRGLRIDASFTKQLPLEHEYMQTFVKHQSEFGSANRVLIALVARDGNMFQADFFDALKKATDEVLVMDGIDRTRVQSLFTPNVRYMEVVEGGIEAGNVVDSEFVPTPEALARVRENILKAGIRGRLVANDFSGALISAIVLEQDATGKPIDPIEVANALESRVREQIQNSDVLVQAQAGGIDVHMIGFAKVMGDIAAGAMSVMVFAVVTILLTLLAVWYYVQSLKVALVPIVCSIVAVVWQLGTLVLLGYGIDPLGLLVPFLIFAIGVSHGVQKISAVKEAAVAGLSSMDAARQTFRQLLMPAIIALLADLVGFITILLIPVQVVQEMAVTASIGVAIVILTDLILLPVLVSWVKWDDAYRSRVERPPGEAHRAVAPPGAHHRAAQRTDHHRGGHPAGRVRHLEGPRNTDRRYPGGRARAAARLALQPGQQHHHQQVLDRRRHPQRHRGDQGAGLHQPRAHGGHRQLRLEDAQCRRRAGGDVAAHRRQDRDRRLE